MNKFIFLIRHIKEIETISKKLQDLSKMIEMDSNWTKQPVLSLKEIVKVHQEQEEKKNDQKKEEEGEQKDKEAGWKKNVLSCLHENPLTLLCVNKREKEDADLQEKKKNEEAVLIHLKSTLKTIHQDHQKHFNYLTQLFGLKDLRQLNSSLTLLFRASEHKWPLADKFHELCDGKGPTITIVRSEFKKLFGGYASISWSSNGWSSAPDSFLFSLDNQTKQIIDKNEKIAIRGNSNYGPSFGGNDLVLSYKGTDLFDSTRPNWSDLGFTYSLPKGMFFESDAAQSYLAGSYRFKVEEYEVFAVSIKTAKTAEKNRKEIISSLKSNIQAIHEDHEKHFQYLADILGFKTINQLAKNIKRLFRASEANSLAEKFHELCDGKGPTIIIARSEYKKLFGGYASISWHTNGDSYAPGSFLFSLDKQTTHIIVKDEQNSIRGSSEYGPYFGVSDLALSYKGYLDDETRPNWSDFGSTYSLPSGITFESNEAKSYLAGSYQFKVEEYEVFSVLLDPEEVTLLPLKSMIKTIHTDYAKNFKYLAELLDIKSLDLLASKLHLLFRASEHNFSKTKFHELCDWKGPTITIIRSNYKKLFGGYGSISWSSSNSDYSASESFLFSLDSKTKHTIYRYEEYALRGYTFYGPAFGFGPDLMICDGISCENHSYLGGSYSLPEGVALGSVTAQSHLAGAHYFETEEYEVFGVDLN